MTIKKKSQKQYIKTIQKEYTVYYYTYSSSIQYAVCSMYSMTSTPPIIMVHCRLVVCVHKSLTGSTFFLFAVTALLCF